MAKRWQHRSEGPDVIIEIVRMEGGRYGVLWARGDDLRVRGYLDRQDAEAQAKSARDKISETGWVDMSVL